MKNNNDSITVVAGDYPAKDHLMLVFVQQLVHALIDQGMNVSVVASQSIIHSLVHRERLLPRHSKGITESGREYDIYRPYVLSFGNNNPFKKITDIFNRVSITSTIKELNSKIVYAHFWSSAIPVYKYALKKNIPLFVACGEGDDALEQMCEHMTLKSKCDLQKAVTGVISVSSENKRKCVDFGLTNSCNIEVIPNCVNTSIFHQMDVSDLKSQLGITEGDFVIGFVGGFIPRKGPDRIAKAITKLDDSQIKVFFIGKPFPGYAYEFDCPGILHKGPLSHEELPKYLNCADVFVMPTQKEGCCNAIVEALAMGLPVISSDRPFNDDILDDKNSIRLDPNDVDAIAAAINKLKEDVDLRKSMSEYSLSRHEEYSIEGRAKRIISFIENQIGKRCN